MHYITEGELEALRVKCATEQQETQTLRNKHEQTLSIHYINTHVDELRTSLDAKKKEAEALRGQQQQTQRTRFVVMI